MDYKETLMWKEINDTPFVLSKIFKGNKDVMSQVVSAIKACNKTNFVVAGRGSSDNAMVYFKYLLEVMSNFTVGLSAPSVITLYVGKVNYSNSIVLGCSQSGYAEDVLEVLKKANEQGALTISITNDSNSPVAKVAKYHLYCNAGEKRSAIATKSFNAEMYILLWLASELAGNSSNIMNLKLLPEAVQKVMPEIDEMTTKYAEKLKNTRNGFTVSRGLTYTIALESSLELQEAAYVSMIGYAGSDFYHGPIAMVNEETPVIIYCAQNCFEDELQNTVRADQIRFIEKMLTLSAPVYLVTNDFMLINRFSKCNDALIVFSFPEEFTVFPFAIFSQMLACKLSCLLGLNPDNPRGLTRNIITR